MKIVLVETGNPLFSNLIFQMNRLFSQFLLIAAMVLQATFSANAKDGKTVDPDDIVNTFPVPPTSSKLMFYVQRTPNTNTIIYELNLKNGEPDKDEPIKINWLRYAEKGQREGLSFIQRKFAYGLKTSKIGDGKWKLLFAPYDKIPFYLQKSTAGIYHVYADINGKTAVLDRIYIRIDPGGSFWAPNVKYVELKGKDPYTGKTVSQRINPKWTPPKQ